jgi:molybdate transport system substrate-binding protein
VNDVPKQFRLTRAHRLAASGVILIILGSVALLLAGTRSTEATNVYAAASLRDAFQKIDGSDEIAYNFAGSGALRDQIEAGAPADIFASASPDEPQELFANGDCERPVTFATNEVAMLVPAGNPSRIQTVYDLETGNRKLAIGVADVPIGSYTREVLSGMGLLGILETNTVTEEQDVTGITSKVALGEVDAGFAYVTDGKIVADQGVRIVPLPAGSQPKVRYQICAVKRGGADTVGAEAYIKKVTGYQGRRVLSEAGFGVPPHPSPDGRR